MYKKPENYRIYNVERVLNAVDILADVGIRYDEDDIKDMERSIREYYDTSLFQDTIQDDI